MSRLPAAVLLLAAFASAATDLGPYREAVEKLASDAMRGRGAGSPELEEAGRWIRDRFEDAGLAPGYRGGWFQSVPGPVPGLFNVVAELPGTGPGSVVLGAHYDGLGAGAPDSEFPGEVLNGADDNASGVAVLLAVARSLASERDLARTVTFVAFTAEETGALGSSAFVAAPPRPLPQTAAMVNLDTVGRIENDRLIVFGTATAEEFVEILNGVNYAFRFDLAFNSEGAGASDHAAFFAKGIPVLHFFSGAKPEIHRPGDDADRLEFPALAKLAGFVTETITYLAATEVPLTYRPAGVERLAGAPARGSNRRRVSFGSIPDFSRESGGILLSGVMPGSPAEAASLEAGDLLVELAGTPLDDIYDFQSALAAHEPGDVVVVKYVRDGVPREVEVTLRERK